MVAENTLHPTARGLRLFLEPNEEIEGLTNLGPTVEEITELDIGRRAAGPLQILVDDSGLLENRGQPVKVAVDVTDSHDPARVGRRRRQHHHQHEYQNEISTPDHHPLLQTFK